MLKFASLSRAVLVLVAFGVGWVVYMVGMILTVYDGLLSLMLQPILAALCSGLTVVLSLLVGLLLRLGPISRLWNGSPRWATTIAAASLFVLTFGYSLGLTYVGTNPETQRQVVVLHPAAALAGYFSLLFSIANWPVQKSEPHGKRAA